MKNFIGYVWALPITIFGLMYVFLFQAVGWYYFLGRKENALVWVVGESSPNFLLKIWSGWGGHTIGNVIVVNKGMEKYPTLLKHELVHVRQCMRLGIFQPVIYGLNLLFIKLGCPEAHPYFDNPFEIEARRSSGETVDVFPMLRKKNPKP